MNKLFTLVLLLLIVPAVGFGKISIEKNLKLGDKDNQVVEVLRKGYKLEEKILRVAQVKVSKRVN